MYQFQHKEYLFALSAILLLAFLYIKLVRWKKNISVKMGDAVLVNSLTAAHSPKKHLYKFIFTITAFALLVLALVNLRKPGGQQTINRKGIDIILALDVSKSMLAEDIKPSRLDKAKQLLSRITDKLSGNRIGIVIFAGKAYLQMPLTTDHRAAKLFISTIHTDIVPTQGTVIGEALTMCNETFNTKEKKFKSIILISDGEDHDASAATIASQLTEQGVVIHSIGVGSPEGAPVILPVTGEFKKDADGNTVISKLNEKTLKDIAEITGGSYTLLVNSEETASALAQQVAGMEQRSITDKSFLNYKSLFQWLVGAALLFLLIEFFITERKKQKAIPAILFIFPALLFLPFTSLSQADNATIKKGNAAYIKNDFKTAADLYRLAAEDNFTAQFNLGNALFRTNETEPALDAFDRAIKSAANSQHRSMAYYNKGVVLHTANRLQECIDAYKNALRQNPADEDARLNLQKALKKMNAEKPKEKKKKKQQQQPKENKDKKQEKPKEGQKQPKPQPSRITKKDAEEKLKTLLEKEKAVQEKLKKAGGSPQKPEKDW